MLDIHTSEMHVELYTCTTTTLHNMWKETKRKISHKYSRRSKICYFQKENFSKAVQTQSKKIGIIKSSSI